MTRIQKQLYKTNKQKKAELPPNTGRVLHQDHLDLYNVVCIYCHF